MSQNLGSRPPERRAARRTKLNLDVEVKISDRTHSMRVCDASASGMLLCAPLRPIHVERFQEVEVRLHGSKDIPPLAATVIRVIDEEHAGGGDFLSGFAVKFSPAAELADYHNLIEDALPAASDITST